MALLLYHLRSKVLRRTADRHSFLVFVVKCAGEAEVGEFDVASFVKENVFGFEAGY